MTIDLLTPEDTYVGSINLETEEITINEDNPINFTCQITGSCCNRLDVQINELDVHHIQEEGYHFDQFLESLSPTIVREGREGVLKYYYVKKREYDHRCVFLDDNNYCKINHIKPFSCKAYPFEMEDNEDDENLVEVFVHSGNVCGGISNATSGNREILENILQAYRENDWDY